MEGRARGKGRDAGKSQQPAGRRPGNGNGRPASSGQQRPGGAWQPPTAEGRGGGGRGGTGTAAAATQKQPATSGYAAAAGAGQGPGPRYGAPAGPPGAEGRATLHRVMDTPGVAGSSSATSAVAGTSESSSTRGSNSDNNGSQRGAMRGKRVISEILRTRPETCVSKKGTTGTPRIFQTNYFRVTKKPTWSIFQYRVDFSPEVLIAGLRNRLIFEQKAKLGGYLFDGSMLFVTKRLPKETVEFMSKDRDGNPIQTIVKFVGECPMTTAASLQVLNLILRRAIGGLKLQLVGRNFFDAVSKIDIKEYNIQLWPGYLTSIRQHEADILLCAELTNKVMRTETVYDIMQHHIQNNRDYVQAIELDVTGMTVLTDYNNKTYRIDSIDFAKSPKSTFETRDGPVSFADYYRNKYNITIKDLNQPLLISKARARDIRGGQSEYIALIPQLCRCTGLTDDMRNNFHLTRAMSSYTRMFPDKRIEKLIQFNKRLNATPDSKVVLDEWDLKLDSALVEVNGRVLNNEAIVFGNNQKVSAGLKADWTKEFARQSLYAAIPLDRWCVIFPPRSSREIKDFISVMKDVAKGFRLQMADPQTIQLTDDRQNSYSKAIDAALNNDIQLLVLVVPNNNADRYSNIKKKCCVDRPVASQVLCHRTITPKGGNPRTLMSVATKVVIQMNCKLGGAPWMIPLPVKGLMTIGFDVCHDTRDKSKSYGALVATMDLTKQVKYFSAVSAHKNGEELSDYLALNVTKAIKEYRQFNNALPDRICFYRDGVGEGQTNYVFDHEIKTLLARLEPMYKAANAQLKLIFIIVSKRINTRIFERGQNAPPGSVVDDIITLPERYDFFIVSQSVNQGTVSPTSYNVLYDKIGLNADHVQQLTYKQTHLYYNWSGTVRVPAVCQYAHKLAFLVGNFIHANPSNVLEKDLYFL